MNQKNLMRRYMRELLIAMSIYVIILIASISILERIELPRFW